LICSTKTSFEFELMKYEVDKVVELDELDKVDKLDMLDVIDKMSKHQSTTLNDKMTK